MTEQRENLIEVLAELSGERSEYIEYVADQLLKHGVVVLPCRCGGCEFERTCKAVNQYLGRDGYCCRARRKGGE